MGSSRSSGISLLELVFAAALVAAAATPLVYSLVWSRHGVVASLEEVLATAEADRLIEAVKQLPFDDVPLSRTPGLSPESEWDGQHFVEAPLRRGRGAKPRPPAQVLASLAASPQVSGPWGVQGPRLLERALGIEALEAGPGGAASSSPLKLVELAVRWKRPGAEGAESGTVRLSAVLSPGESTRRMH